MPYTPAGIISFGFPQTADKFTFTYALSGSFATEALVAANAGLAVELDTTAPSTVKQATDGSLIFGRVFVAENRSVLGMNVASVQRKFKEKLPATTGHGIAVGDSVVGAGAGLVRKAVLGGLSPDANGAAARAGNIVVETGTDFVVVEKF